jgi:hypothetical protein
MGQEQDILERIKLHAERIAELSLSGAVAVVCAPDVAPEVRVQLGANDGSLAFAMSDEVRKAMIADCLKRGDSATVRWLRADSSGRIFYVSGSGGTLLINFEPGKGYSIEPGSTDEEWKS